MEKKEELDQMIEEMFEDYMSKGFDFNSDMSFTEVFKKIYSDAVNMTIEILENIDDDDDEKNKVKE
jgi:hypothetical protein